MSTNYYDTLIVIAPDSPTERAIVPDLSKSSVASQQYAWLRDAPYELTSDDLLFRRVAERENIPEEELATARAEYFQKGRACLRTSPLPKRYGWGLHADAAGKLALVAAESDEYRALVEDERVAKIPAVRSSRK